MDRFLKLMPFDLQDREEWKQFYDLFSAYLKEVCDEEEYGENIADLHNDKLNKQMINQTLQKRNPYIINKVILNDNVIGLISYSFNEEKKKGFINNFYICPRHRNTGIGSSVYMMTEKCLKALGAVCVELIPVKRAEQFYIRNGFKPTRTSYEGERIYSKIIL